MTKIRVKSLAHAVAQTKSMDLKQKEAEFDRIFKEQPNLLGSVIVLHNMGRSYEEIDVLLNLLLVSFMALKHGKIQIETVSEKLQVRELDRYAGHIKFLDGLSKKDHGKAMADYIDSHNENILLAFATDEMNNAGFPHIEEESAKYLMSCGINIVNCIAAAKIT